MLIVPFENFFVAVKKTLLVIIIDILLRKLKQREFSVWGMLQHKCFSDKLFCLNSYLCP